MKYGVAIPQRSWPDQGNYTYRQVVEFAQRAERLRFNSAWLSDHYFLDFGGPRLSVGPEPVTALGYIAAETETIALGTMVLCAGLRPPGHLAREATTINELSGGRITIGLGAGWHEPEFDAFSIPFDHRYSRFVEYAEILSALFAGGPVDYDGTYNTLNGGEVLGGSKPRLMIAGAQPKMIALAARLADAWTMPGSYERFPELLPKLRDEEIAAGKPAGGIESSCAATALLIDESEANRLLEEQPPPTPVVIGIDGLLDITGTLEAQGADEVILHFSGAVWTNYAFEHLDMAAEALGL